MGRPNAPAGTDFLLGAIQPEDVKKTLQAKPKVIRFFFFNTHTHRTSTQHTHKKPDPVYGSVSLSATGDCCGAERWIALARQRASSVKPSMREFSRQMTAETWRSLDYNIITIIKIDPHRPRNCFIMPNHHLAGKQPKQTESKPKTMPNHEIHTNERHHGTVQSALLQRLPAPYDSLVSAAPRLVSRPSRVSSVCVRAVVFVWSGQQQQPS